MQNIVRSVLGAYVQTCQLLGLPIILKPNSTLNQKFDVQNGIAFGEDDKVSCKYLTIGNGGHRIVAGTNGIPKVEPVQHTPRDCALYNHLPFVLRLPNDDLAPEERANYRIRRQETHGGQIYIAYYLRVLDLSQTVPQLELRVVQDGVTTSTPYDPQLSDLNPTPPAITPGGVLVTTGDYVAATGKVPFTMNAWDIEELLNVSNILYGDEGYAMISELALCTGADRIVTGEFNGVSSSYVEAVGVQVTCFINTFFSAVFNNQSIETTFDVGSVEPMLALSQP